MLKIVSFLVLATVASAQSWTYGLDADGVVRSWQAGKVPASSLKDAVSVVVLDAAPGEFGGRAVDDEHVSQVRYRAGKMERRPKIDVSRERAAKIRRREILEARRALDEATTLQSTDPSMVTSAEIQALRDGLERAKALR